MGNYLIKNKNVRISDSLLVVGEKALVANEDLPKNTIVFLYEDSATDQRTRTSIQVAENKHIEPGEFGEFANHSCSPNSQIIANYDDSTNIAEVLMITVLPIKKGEEITFDYATTETTVTADLLNKKCLCKSQNCRGKIVGFNGLSLKEKMLLLSKDLTANYMQITED
ncbi:MAG: SET domain-containing protein [Bacteroidales bacterium]|nr:SET domain-containing protein [Bacteroidales bacterium]